MWYRNQCVKEVLYCSIWLLLRRTVSRIGFPSVLLREQMLTVSLFPSSIRKWLTWVTMAQELNVFLVKPSSALRPRRSSSRHSIVRLEKDLMAKPLSVILRLLPMQSNSAYIPQYFTVWGVLNNNILHSNSGDLYVANYQNWMENNCFYVVKKYKFLNNRQYWWIIKEI